MERNLDQCLTERVPTGLRGWEVKEWGDSEQFKTTENPQRNQSGGAHKLPSVFLCKSTKAEEKEVKINQGSGRAGPHAQKDASGKP